jgi:hypothetical protein
VQTVRIACLSDYFFRNILGRQFNDIVRFGYVF